MDNFQYYGRASGHSWWGLHGAPAKLRWLSWAPQHREIAIHGYLHGPSRHDGLRLWWKTDNRVNTDERKQKCGEKQLTWWLHSGPMLQRCVTAQAATVKGCLYSKASEFSSLTFKTWAWDKNWNCHFSVCNRQKFGQALLDKNKGKMLRCASLLDTWPRVALRKLHQIGLHHTWL